jgi:SAM-dependent methyltransferase
MTIVNRDQAEHWNSGEDAGHWVTHHARYDQMLEPFTGVILDAAHLTPADRVLDVGCGCGATTLAAARAVTSGDAVGVDLSVTMLARAREAAEAAGVRNVTFEVGDAQVHPFQPASFDAVISRFGVMFFADPVGAFANLRAATRTGGIVSFVCWQPLAANEWLLVPGAALAEHVPLPDFGSTDAPGMFAFADPDRVRRVLSDAGWHGVDVMSEQPSILVGGGGTLDNAVDFLRTGSMGRNLLAGVDPDTEARAIASVRDALAPHVEVDGVRLEAAVWMVTATA